MYSRIELPQGVKSVTLLEPFRISMHAMRCGRLTADRLNDETWYVFDHNTGIIEAVYSMARNGHGWSPSEAHAKSHLNRENPIHPFELDMIP